MRQRLAVSGVFLLVGIMLGTWFARLPDVRDGLGVSYGEFGVILLAQTVGVIISMQVAGRLTARFGTRAVIRLTSVVVPWFLPLAALMPSALGAATAMLGWGLVAGLLDVGMTAQGVRLEQIARRPILNGLHAVWGAGALTGSVTTVIAERSDVPVHTQFWIVAGGLAVIALVAGRDLLPETLTVHPPRRRAANSWPRTGWTRSVVILGVLGAAAALCETAVSSWCGIFLQQQRGAPSGLASLGYTAFVLAETAARTVGDRLHRRFGAVTLVRGAMTLTVLGVVLAVAVPSVWLGIIGFALQGCGIAVLVPIISGAVGHGANDDRSSSATSLAIARFSTLYYVGVVAGPSLIGWLAQVFGIGTALGLVMIPLAAIGLLARTTAPASRMNDTAYTGREDQRRAA
ncbi:MAG TPA: MFS transporter [Pseudonocardiaceae bacterium]|jgi:MFS family permease|nr:MFS transporter [Pseudonocardiaceae bacterium]